MTSRCAFFGYKHVDWLVIKERSRNITNIHITTMSTDDKLTPGNIYDTPTTIRSFYDVPTRSPINAMSCPTTVITTSVTPLVSNIESQPGTARSEPTLHQQQQRRSLQSTGDLGDDKRNAPKFDTQCSITSIDGHDYEVIDDEKLDPCHKSNDVISPDIIYTRQPKSDGTVCPALSSPNSNTCTFLSNAPPPLPKRYPSLHPVRIVDYSEPDKEQVSMSSDCCRQILVEGIPVSMTIKELGNSFETEILPEGDIFEDIKFDRTLREAVITLKSTTATSKLIQRAESGERFILQGNEVCVSSCHQSPTDPLKVFMLGLTDDTTADAISIYVEKRCGMRPSEVNKGERPEVTLLCFDNPPDITKMQLAFENQSSEVVITPVERTKRIKIRDVAMETTAEFLKHYFENNQLFKGGGTESIIYREHVKDFIITFASIEDAESVVKQGIHTVNEAQLDVSFYYPCLDQDEEYFVKIPSPKELRDLNRHMCRFLHISAKYKNNLEEMVNIHHGKVIWPDEKSDEFLRIQCDVDEDDRLGKIKVKDWNQNSARVVSEKCKMLDVQYKDCALEIMTRLRSEIQRMGVADPESIYVSFEENIVVIAGEMKLVAGLSAKVESLIPLMEEDLVNDGQHVTKIVKLKKHELELFQEFNCLEQLKDVDTSIKKEMLFFKGRKKMVEEAILRAKQLIKDFPKENIEGINMFDSSLLQAKETTVYVKRKMNESKVTGVWEFSEHGDLVMYSKTSDELKAAVNILKSSLKSSTIHITQRIGNYLQHADRKENLAKLERKYEGRLRLKAGQDKFYIVSVDNLHEEINETVMKFLDSHTDVAEVLHLDPGVFRYIFSYKTIAIDKIIQQYKNISVEIDIIDKQTRKGFMISGEKESCKLAIVDLHVLIETVTRTDYITNWPLFDKFLRSPKGINELSKIELDEKCVIRISTVDTHVITDKPRRSVLAECKIGHCDTKIVEGDITEREVELIVNPTDSMLDHKRGLGRTLVDKGGFSIQKDCNDYIQRTQYMKDGDIFVGKAGCLPCRNIIHAVIPTWTGGSNNEEFVLSNVITQCLTEADNRNVASIAFPPIGAGRFGYPSETIAEVMITAIKKYLIAHGTETCLRQVYICDIDRAILSLLVNEIERGFGQTSVMIQELHGRGQTEPKEPSKTGDSAKKITREIVIGSISEQDTDVIANSTNSSLDLRVGSISHSLVKEGGETILSEAKEKYPNGIIRGEIAETSGGNLKCKALFHGVLVQWNEDPEYAEMIMKSFVRNCLFTSHKKHYKSIAFPLLGAGALGYPADRVAEIMFKAIDTFEQQLPVSSLKIVRIIIRSENEKAFKDFEKYTSQCDREGQTSRLSDISFRQSCQEESVFIENGGAEYSTTIGHVTLCIEQGDLTKATTAVIVNSVSDDLNIESGNISRAILKAAGHSIQSEANENRKSFKEANIVMTSSGRLLCQKIIHVRARNSASKWKKAVAKCLAAVEKSSLNSVSFPALGTGGKGLPPAEMARTMVVALQEYILGDSYKGCLKNVRIVVYETEMAEVFKKEVKAILENSQRKSFFPDLLKFRERKPTDETECSRMVFHIYTESPVGDTEVFRRIEDIYTEFNKSVP